MEKVPGESQNGRIISLLKKHPCFDEEAHSKYGRVHLPVSPSCNIQCRFCERCASDTEQRPGVSRGLLSPEKAVETVERALELVGRITVVGIAGPGDTLATDHALEAFRRVHARFPKLIKCLSTNGLLLWKRAAEVVDAGVSTVTVTVNAVHPEIVGQIVSHVAFGGKRLTGAQASLALVAEQLGGIREVVRLGGTVKVNTVLIPGVNDAHVGEVARVVSGLGASSINLIPLIPRYGMSALRAPSPREIHEARAVAERYLPVFRHCRQCRADACGVPGAGAAGDVSSRLYAEPMQTFSHG